MRSHRLVPVGLQNALLVIYNVDTGFHQMRIVERLKSVEFLGALLGRTISAKQMSAKVDADFWYLGMSVGIFGCCNLNAGDEILLAVGPQLSYRQLRARENDRFGKILQHIGEGRGGVGHRVRSVQHHKTVIIVVVIGNDVAEVSP